MEYKNLTRLISSSREARRYYMSLPVEIRLELHKYNDAVRNENDLRDRAAQIGQRMNYNVLSDMPHEYSLY